MDVHLQRELQVLYGGQGATPAQMQQANQWLTQFQKHEEAGQHCRTLLQGIGEGAPLGLLFFLINTQLLDQRRHCRNTNPPAHPNPQQSPDAAWLTLLGEWIKRWGDANFRSVRLKCYQLLGAIWTYSGSMPFDQFYFFLLSWCGLSPEEISLNVLQAQPLERLFLLLGTLQMVPEEIDRSPLLREDRATRNQFLRSQKQTVLDICHEALHEACPVPLRALALGCLKSWNEWLLGSRMILPHPVYSRMWHALETPLLFADASDTLNEFLARPFGSLSIEVSQNVLRLRDLFQSAASGNNEQSWEVCQRLTWLVSAFAEDNAHNIARDAPSCEKFAELMLSILSHPQKALAMHALLFFEKAALFYPDANENQANQLMTTLSHATAHILRHLHTKPAGVSEYGARHLLALSRMDEEQIEEHEDAQVESLEEYLEFYRQASRTLEGIAKRMGDAFYMILFQALGEDIAWMDAVLTVCVGSVPRGQKEEGACPPLEKLVAYLLGEGLATASPSTMMLFVGSHAKWLRGYPVLVEHSLRAMITLLSGGGLDEVTGLAVSLALEDLACYQRQFFLEEPALTTEVIEHLQQALIHFHGPQRIRWMKSLVQLTLYAPASLAPLTLTNALNRPWISLLQQGHAAVITELEAVTSAFKVLEAENHGPLRSVAVEFIRQFVNLWSSEPGITDHPLVLKGICTTLEQAIFCAQQDLLPVLNIVVQFVGMLFQQHGFACFLHVFASLFRLYLNTETVNHFLEILKMLTETALRWLGDRGVHAHVVMVGEYFAMLGQWHEHHALDQFLQTGNYLDQVMQLSVASLSVMDPTTIQAVLDFLQVLLERIHDLGSLPHCQELYQATLKCIPNLYRKTGVQKTAAGVLYIYRERMERSVLCSWMAPVLVTWQEGARLTPEDMERVQSLLCTLQPKMRYRALVVDLSKICSEEMTPDALVAYEF